MTSLIGSILGFFVLHYTIKRIDHAHSVSDMRLGMLNSMPFAFIFAMFIELITNNKILAIILPITVISVAMITRAGSITVPDLVEFTITALMSTSMSIMLIGMTSSNVIFVIQFVLVYIELMLFFTVIMPQKKSSGRT